MKATRSDSLTLLDKFLISQKYNRYSITIKQLVTWGFKLKNNY